MATVSEPAASYPASALWRGVAVGLAALAMVATLPGRTHGLGIITEPLLKDLGISRVSFADLNLWATLFGAAFCIPTGWLIDRAGARITLVGVLGLLAGVVLAMSHVRGEWRMAVPEWMVHAQLLHDDTLLLDLWLAVLLTRGLGQSALSVLSLALIGQAAGKKPGLAVGVYSLLTALGFMTAVGFIKVAYDPAQVDWRALWRDIGWCVFFAAILSAVAFGLEHAVSLAPQAPQAPRPDGAGSQSAPAGAEATPSWTLRQALGTPAFWVFSIAISFYGLLTAGLSLFGESILRERGFDREEFLTVTTFSPMVGLASNLVTGALAMRFSLARLLAAALLVLASALALFPAVYSLAMVYTYATLLGAAGGMITVLFFAIWMPAYGPSHLGRIQGAAQMMTVFASALGPLLLALCKEHYQSYVPLYHYACGICLLLGLAAWITPMPGPAPSLPERAT